MQIVFGPILSRRFGVSLGVDLSPKIKQCNFDCVYCELSARKPVDTQTSVIPVSIIIDSIKEALKQYSDIQVLTFSANGEPTLYPFLKELIVEVKENLKLYPNIKTLILSNGSLFGIKKEALKYFDIVKFSIDSAVLQNFKRVDKPSKTLNLDSIKKGIKDFSNEFKGDLVAEVLIVNGLNDDIESNTKTAEFLSTINIKRVDISTIDRPSSHNVKPVSNDKLYELSNVYKNMNVCVVTRKDNNINITPRELTNLEIIELLKRRPLTQKDCEILLTENSYKTLTNMLSKNEIKTRDIAGVSFYCV